MTFSLETLIMVGAILFCLGGLIGAVISRTLLPPAMQRDLEQRLQISKNELEQYQHDVAKHFVETSKRVANLTHAYKEVHEHIARGAIQLTNAEISKKILDAGATALENQDSLEEISFEPPKDWAPKRPGQTGTLSEEFGLEEQQEETNVASITANPNVKSLHPGKG